MHRFSQKVVLNLCQGRVLRVREDKSVVNLLRMRFYNVVVFVPDAQRYGQLISPHALFKSCCDNLHLVSLL